MLDVRGIPCPKPIVMSLNELKNLNPGDVLEVLTDSEETVGNLLRMAMGKNCKAVVTEQDGCKVVSITKGEDDSPADPEISCSVVSNNSGAVVAVGTNKMGEGDEKLGKILIKSYIYSLTQLEKMPKTVIFFNSGAYLTCEGSESLEDIKTLSDNGVDIYTCGTCLDFYGIKDKLRVGAVTNMYEIARLMSEGAPLIRI